MSQRRMATNQSKKEKNYEALHKDHDGLGGELSWEDEERLDGILAEYVGTYRNAGGKYMMITGEQGSFVFQPSKIGAFEGNVSIYTWKDGEDYYTNKYKMEGDSKVTVLCEGRAGHYAEGVEITFVFEDGTITVSAAVTKPKPSPRATSNSFRRG